MSKQKTVTTIYGPKLTERQWEYALLVADGWSDSTIAEMLGVSRNSVMGATKTLYRAFGLSNQQGVVPRVQLALIVTREVEHIRRQAA